MDLNLGCLAPVAEWVLLLSWDHLKTSEEITSTAIEQWETRRKDKTRKPVKHQVVEEPIELKSLKNKTRKKSIRPNSQSVKKRKKPTIEMPISRTADQTEKPIKMKSKRRKKKRQIHSSEESPRITDCEHYFSLYRSVYSELIKLIPPPSTYPSPGSSPNKRKQ